MEGLHMRTDAAIVLFLFVSARFHGLFLLLENSEKKIERK